MQVRESRDPLEEIGADVLVLFHVQDEPAPRGRLGRIDWILGSAVSRLRAQGKFAGERGSAALLGPNGKLKAERVLVFGLGRQAELSLAALYRLSYQAAHTILGLHCTHIALEPPFRAFPLEPPGRIGHAFLEGFLAELKRARPQTSFSITVLPPPNGA